MINVDRLKIIKKLKLLSFLSTEEIDLICEIVFTLNEPNIQLIERIVHRLGTNSCRNILNETINILQNGGLRKSDGFKRTRGGVFIALVKKQIDNNTIDFIWREQKERQKEYKRVKRRSNKNISEKGISEKKLSEKYISEKNKSNKKISTKKRTPKKNISTK